MTKMWRVARNAVDTLLLYCRKNKYQNYSSEDLRKAVALVKKGNSLRKAQSKTGVPTSTIKDHARGKYANVKFTKQRGPKTLTSDEEQSLVNYIKYMSDSGFPLGRNVIKKLTIDIVKTSGKQNTRLNKEKGPSNKWMRSFMSRHKNLSLRTPHPLERARSELKSSQIEEYFELLEKTLVKLDIKDKPSQIFNVDETGFAGKEFSKQKIVVPKGTKHPYQPCAGISGHVTLNLGVSASGKAIAPLIIFSKNLPRESFRDSLSEEWSFETTESGYINNTIFSAWFNNQFVRQCGRARPVLVIMDNHSSHITKQVVDTARENNIHLLCLPAHSTHLLQPLDVGVFHLLKSNVAQMCTSLGYTGMKTLPRHKFPKVIHLGLNKISGSAISSSFRAAGIHPFNAKKIELPKSTRDPEMILPDPTEAANAESSAGPSETDAGTECRHGKPVPNILVALGLVSSELEFVLREPPKIKSKAAKRKTCKNARLITSSPQSDVVTIKNQKAKKVKLSSDDTSSDVGESQTICEICMTGSNSLTWFGCDECTRWIHYECLPHDHQIDLDLSLITGDPWLCNSCRSEQ
ncbi:tigger transposable element-derived protein 1-like [Pecten maximus]|uniref:tigger transposable element-derived protein 1-like n=1 Tax=Pecten maximus TaxID=6579 RepID=UPI001457EE23|nr:tigger transposable element-derived protein 1-like [Pecten maximus]